jgi:hypothetical protein
MAFQPSFLVFCAPYFRMPFRSFLFLELVFSNHVENFYLFFGEYFITWQKIISGHEKETARDFEWIGNQC